METRASEGGTALAADVKRGIMEVGVDGVPLIIGVDGENVKRLRHAPNNFALFTHDGGIRMKCFGTSQNRGTQWVEEPHAAAPHAPASVPGDTDFPEWDESEFDEAMREVNRAPAEPL